MNPTLHYTFRSAKGIDVTISSRIGADSARIMAMLHLWGPPHGWCQNKGTGLHLISVRETEDVA